MATVFSHRNARCRARRHLHASAANAQDRVRIGVLNDQSGVFSTYQGIGSVIAAQMAVEDYGGKAAGKPVDVITADHQNKTDVGSASRGDGTTMTATTLSSTCRTRQLRSRSANMSEQKNKVFIGSGAGRA